MLNNGYYNPREPEEVRNRNTSVFENFMDVFDDSETRFPHRIAVKYVDEGGVVEITDGRFFEDVRRLSSVIVREGAQYGHIGLIAPNSYLWIVAYAAILYTGSVAVLFDAATNPAAFAEQAKWTDVTALIYDQAVEATVDNAGLDGVTRMRFQPGRPDVICLEEEMKKEPVPIENKTGKDDLSVIFFTSGTTGKNKAVMLTNRQNYSGVTNFTLDYHSMLILLPLHHIAGFTIGLNAIINGGSTCIGRDPRQTQQYYSDMKPDASFVVPALLEAMRARLEKVNFDQSALGWNLRYLICGGAKFQPGSLEDIEKAGIEVWQIYASSESGGQGILGRMDTAHEDSIGRDHMRNVIADIMDGELVIRGDSVFEGYYKDEESTREVLIDGWYHTGDLCRRDEDGYYYLTGRKSNLIILSNGENVSPEELESMFFAADTAHDIREAMVFAKNNFLAAEFLLNTEEGASEEAKEAARDRVRSLVEQCGETLPLYKAVHFVTFRDTPFPRNAAGKLIRERV